MMNDIDLSKMLVNLANIYAICVEETNMWEMAETACDLLLDIIDIEFRKNIWFFKIRALAVQNKSESEIIEMIRECNSTLQAKLLVQMAYYVK